MTSPELRTKIAQIICCGPDKCILEDTDRGCLACDKEHGETEKADAILALTRAPSGVETMTSVPPASSFSTQAGEQVPIVTYAELVESYYADEGYPSDAWIDKFDALPHTAIKPNEAADFLVNRLPEIAKTISCMQVRIEDAKDRYSDKPMKRIEYITGGWSGAESLIGSMLRQFWIRHFHSRWERGGYFVFEVPGHFLSTPPDDSLVLKKDEQSEMGIVHSGASEMSDLGERLRAKNTFGSFEIEAQRKEAADEIESLTDRLSFAEFEWHRATDGMKERDAEIERLREQLGKAICVLEMCQECIRGETPEDMTDQEAREYVISKIREIILPDDFGEKSK